MISQNSAPQQNLVTAPKLHISRNKINWTDEGVKEYETVVSPHLQEIRKRWLDPDSLSSMSIVLKMTNTILSSSAVATNKSQSLDSNFNQGHRRQIISNGNWISRLILQMIKRPSGLTHDDKGFEI